MKQISDEKIIESVQRHVSGWNSGFLKGPMGYRFYTKKFLSLVFLYSNSVDAKNPDITGPNNHNTFINDAQEIIAKIKEQVRLDLIDINFRIFNDIYLGKFIVKAANAKMLMENKFDVEIDAVVDDAVDYGSGFLKVWKTAAGKMKMRSVDPYKLIWDQNNFEKGRKTESIPKTYRELIMNEKYDLSARSKLREEIGEDVDDKWDETVAIQQNVRDLPDGKQEIIITVLDHDIVLFNVEVEKQVYYMKFDYKKRRGFPDALGIGTYEMVFNRLVQSKVNRERLDKLMELASLGLSQKKLDGETDAVAGKNMVKAKTGSVVGYVENPIEPLNLGYEENIAHVKNEINDMANGVGASVNVNDATLGKTLPASTSGVLGTLLDENSSSVLKDVQINFGNWLGHVYNDAKVKKYLLDVFKSEDNLEKYLQPNDLKMVKRQIVGYMVARAQIEAEVNGEEFNEAGATAKARSEMNGKAIIPGALLEALRKDVEGITLFITGERFNKSNAVAFLREMRTRYEANPDRFRDPAYVEMLKQEAELEVGIDAIQIEEILNEMPELEQPQVFPQRTG